MIFVFPPIAKRTLITNYERRNVEYDLGPLLGKFRTSRTATPSIWQENFNNKTIRIDPALNQNYLEQTLYHSILGSIARQALLHSLLYSLSYLVNKSHLMRFNEKGRRIVNETTHPDVSKCSNSKVLHSTPFTVEINFNLFFILILLLLFSIMISFLVIF